MTRRIIFNQADVQSEEIRKVEQYILENRDLFKRITRIYDGSKNKYEIILVVKDRRRLGEFNLFLKWCQIKKKYF